MIGCIKAISPCVKSASAKLFLDLHTVLAPRDEERTLDTGPTRCAIFLLYQGQGQQTLHAASPTTPFRGYSLDRWIQLSKY